MTTTPTRGLVSTNAAAPLFTCPSLLLPPDEVPFELPTDAVGGKVAVEFEMQELAAEVAVEATPPGVLELTVPLPAKLHA